MSFWTRRERRREAVWGIGLVSVWVLGFLIFTAFPLVMAVYISFTNWAPIHGPFWQAHVIGLKNYQTFLSDQRFWHSVWNTIYYAVGSVALINIIAIPVAVLLNQRLKAINIFRTIVYLPAVVPAVATAVVFRIIFMPGVGAVSWFLTAIHAQCNPLQLTCTAIDWLNNPALTMPVVIIMSAWGLGAPLLIYLAGLQGIDSTYYEAAAIDGAGSWATFRSITLPLLTPAIFFNIVTGMIGAFQEFSKFVIFSGGLTATGGPDDSLLSTFWYIFIRGFDFQEMGIATAMAFGLFALIAIFTLANFWGQRRWVFYQSER